MRLFLSAALILSILARDGICQKSADTGGESDGKRIFWIIPNFSTSPTLKQYRPLSAGEKFKIARQDTLDPGAFALAALFAGASQASNSNPSFGQGAQGYAHYFGTAYGDLLIAGYLTEGVYPTLLHQDPRYFRRGSGRVLSRLFYSVGQIFLTHGDSGGTQFNFSELAGTSSAIAISTSYYPENRNAADVASRVGIQFGIDMATNVLKEFAPDLGRKFSHRHGKQEIWNNGP